MRDQSEIVGRWHDVQVEALIPIRVQRFLDDGRGSSLLSVDRDDGERIRES